MARRPAPPRAAGSGCSRSPGRAGWWASSAGWAGSPPARPLVPRVRSRPARVVVSQYRLAAHLGLAIALFGYVFWSALEMIGAPRTANLISERFRPWAIALSGLVFVQMLLGAFMAGLDAGRAFSDWPTYG